MKRATAIEAGPARRTLTKFNVGISNSMSVRIDVYRQEVDGLPNRLIRKVNFIRHLKARSRILHSGLFDAEWYLDQNPDVKDAGCDPIIHFYRHGAREGRWPHPLFHTDWYLATYPDVAKADYNALLHYLEHGAHEGRWPNPLFDSQWYMSKNPACAVLQLNPLLHYARFGGAAAKPSASFDVEYYRAAFPEIIQTGVSALESLFRQRPNAPEPMQNSVIGTTMQIQIDAIRRSGLFDAKWYNEKYPEGALAANDPLLHFMKIGVHAGNWPNPLFETDWYIARNPDIIRAGLNPLYHYIMYGEEEHRRPTPLFDPLWYRSSYSDAADQQNADGGLLAHFLKQGGKRTSPSVHFDAVWYRDRNVDVERSGENALVQYVKAGRSEGRLTRSLDSAFNYTASCTEARLARVRSVPRRYGSVALFVTHSPSGTIKGHVDRYAAMLQDAGIDVVLIIAADQRRTAIPKVLEDRCSAIYVRKNVGFDFAAWSHVLQEDLTLFTSETIYLINDSMIGPLDRDDFMRLIKKVREAKEDIISLTDSYEYGWHLQSFFLAIKRRALSSYALHAYLNDVINFDNKDDVIRHYELTFGPRMRASAITCAALFPSEVTDRNRSIYGWRNLVRVGFPFIKASLVDADHQTIGGTEAKALIKEFGIDLTVLEASMRTSPKIWADLSKPSTAPQAKPRVAFYGPWNYASGLGAASRGYMAALQQTDLTFAMHPVKKPWGEHALTAPSWSSRSFSGAPDVAIVHLNPEAWGPLLTEKQHQEIAAARLRIGLFVWETSIVPSHWMPVINDVDAIWVPSDFCAQIFRNLTNVPVEVVPHVVQPEIINGISPKEAKRVRKSFRLDPDKNVILYVFDGTSNLSRKNPQALIRAFRNSGLGKRGWQLVLKTKHILQAQGEGEVLMQLVMQEQDIAIINNSLTRYQLDNVFAIADIYASSHSSEGFGLTIAEAMAFGKIVVATHYGGSCDFLDDSCGFPVPAREVMIEEDDGPYPRGSVWGAVDEKVFASSLVAAADAFDVKDSIGLRAAARIRDRLSAKAIGLRIERHVHELLNTPNHIFHSPA